MKRLLGSTLLLLVLFGMIACQSQSSSKSRVAGTVAFQMDFSTLQSAAAMKKVMMATSSTSTVDASTITGVTVTISRQGYADVVSELIVSNNVASGTVSGLEQGYWHVSANVYNGQTLIYTGAVDVNVIAGAQVAAEILFDPVSTPTGTATTGDVNVTVGLNKYPGYKKIQQYISFLVQDTVAQKIYIVDSSTNLLGVYDANTLIREQDITLPAAPQSVAVDAAGGAVLLGYTTGKIYRLNIADQSFTQLADALISVNSIVPIGAQFILVGNGSSWGSSNTYEMIDLTNGQIVSSKSYWYPLNNFVYNPAVGMVYALDSGLSPADMHHISVNASTGAINSITDSRYHGDYSFGSPIRVAMNGSRVIASSGNMFVSSSGSDDITYTGNLGHTLADIVSDDDLGNLYALNSDGIQKLLVVNQGSLFTTLSVDLVATPKTIFDTQDTIVVFVVSGADTYVRVFSKKDLGLK